MRGCCVQACYYMHLGTGGSLGHLTDKQMHDMSLIGGPVLSQLAASLACLQG